MEVKQLCKTYKTEYEIVHALNEMNLQFPDHGLVFIVGVSGSGKSTLMNMLSGVDTPTSGEVIVEGKSLFVEARKELFGYRNSYVGLIFQDCNLIEDMNVYDNIKLPLELLGETDFSVIDKVIKKVDIEEIRNSNVNEISSGQMQRVAIARALVKDSAIILADEPTGNLDSKNTKIVMDLLKEISKTRLVVVITHDDEAAYEYGDRIISIEDGTILNDERKNDEILNPLSVKRSADFIDPKIKFSKQVTFTKNFIRSNLARSLAILLLMILIPFIGNVLCGYVFFDIEKSYSSYQDEYNSEFIKLASEYSGYTVNYNTDDYIDMLDRYPESNLIEVYGINYHIVDIIPEDEDYFYKATVKNLIIDDGYFNYVLGDQPLKENEIAVTDYFVEAYNFYTGNNIGIGSTIRLNGVSFKICGIVETSYCDFLDFDRSDLFISMAFEENLEYYNAFYVSVLGQSRWWQEMTYFEEDVKYTNNVTSKTEIYNISVIMRKRTIEPSVIEGSPSYSGRYGVTSEKLWKDVLTYDNMGNISKSPVASYPVSFLCTNRTKYTFAYRSSGYYDPYASGFENPNDYEVIVGTELFEKYRDKQYVCKFLVKSNDVNYRDILMNENITNQSFAFAKATWNRAESSKYVMIEFIITMLLIMTVFAFIMNSMTMNSEKKKIGIKYSFGIKKKDIIVPYLLELVLYIILGLTFSLLITKIIFPLIMNGLVYTTPQEIKEYYFFYIGWGSILGWDLIIYLIMVSSLLVMIYRICKKSPIEIIKDL